MMARARRDPVETSVDPAERAREVALRLLSQAPRSAAQLKAGLIVRGVEESTADAVIERYREVGLVDDEALAAMIARTRHRERGHARWAIRDELSRKGFRASDIEAALGEISDEDEQMAATALATRRWAAMSNVSAETRIRRVIAALGRKGYSPGVALSLVRTLQDADRGGGSIGETLTDEEA